MEYVCTESSFRFFNGTDIYTVRFVYSLMKWFVHKDDERRNALYCVEVNPKRTKSPNREGAETVLWDYLEKIPEKN